MSDRMVIVIEYEVITGEHVESRDYMQRALIGAMTQIREGADRLNPDHVKVVAAHVGVEDFVDRVLALFAKDASAPSKPPPSPVETTAGSGQRPDHTDVIRPADEAEGDWCAHVTLARIYREERDAALKGIIRRDDALGIYDAEVTRLHASLDDKDATIDRLWAQLNEATNTPHNDPEFGFDKTAALSDPGTPMCLVHPEHFMPCSRCLGYGCTACDNGVQAADDRRSL